MKRQIETQTRRSTAAVSRADDDALLTLVAAGLRLQSGENWWRVSGNTLPHRQLLRDGGGSWNKFDQCWEFSGADPTVTLAAALEAQPASCGHNSGKSNGEKPHYWGHRGRMRERVLKAGVETLADYEVLELLLFYSIERTDTKPLANRLLDRFGTLGDVFAAEPEQLREFEIDRRTLVHFKAMREVGRRLAERKVKDMPVLTNWQQLIDYCHVALAHEKTEQFRILFLDRKNVLIADEGAAARHHRPHAGLSARGRQARAGAQCRGPDPRAQPSLGRSQALARRHRDDQGDPSRLRSARHLGPRSSRDQPQGSRELQEPRTDLISYFAYLAIRMQCRTAFELAATQIVSAICLLRNQDGEA